MNLNFLQNLIPPDDPDKLNKWRWFIAIALSLTLVDGFIGRGFIFSSGSYAYASDVVKIEDRMDRMYALSIAATLRDLRVDECRANGNKRVIRNTMEDYQQDYEELKGKRYPLLSCKEIKET